MKLKLYIFVLTAMLGLSAPTTLGQKTGRSLPFKTIDKNLQSGHTERKDYVIKTPAEWEKLWKQIHPDSDAPPSPQINFNKQMVIAVFQGQKPSGGYAIEIKKLIYGSNKKIEATVEEKSPGKGCMATSALTTPYHIVVVAKRNQEIVFTHTQSTQDCN